MEAVKYDSEKPKLGLVPPKAVTEIGKAMTYGSKKYEDYNYKKGDGLDWNRYYDALLRHINAWLGGEEYDPESGLRHTSHAGACMVMLIDVVESGIGKDTRFRDPRTPKEHARAFDMAAENLKRYVKSGESDADKESEPWIRLPSKYGLPFIPEIIYPTCVYEGQQYDITKAGYFPVTVLKAFLEHGHLDADSVCYPNDGSHTRYVIGDLDPVGKMWFPGIYIDMPVSAAHMRKDGTCTYRDVRYDISKPGFFPVNVLREFLHSGHIRWNMMCYSQENTGEVNTVKWAVRNYDGDRRVWFPGYSKKVERYHHKYALRYRGRSYNIKTAGMFPAPVLKKFRDLRMISGNAVCYSGIRKWGRFKVSKIMKQDWSQEYWYDPSEKRLWHDGKVYDFKTNGWFPRKVLLDAYRHGMLPGNALCWADSMRFNTSLQYLYHAEHYGWPDEDMRYHEYFIYGRRLD